MKSKTTGILFLALSLTAAACAQRKGVSKGKGGGAPKSSTAPTYVSMRRTPCFGSCPVYTLEVMSDGTVRYTGTRFTPRTGTFQKSVGTQKTGAVLQQFAKYRADTCSDKYGMRIPDLPGLNFVLRMPNGREKPIGNAQEGPLFLRRLAAEMDSLGGVDDTWTRVEDPARE